MTRWLWTAVLALSGMLGLFVSPSYADDSTAKKSVAVQVSQQLKPYDLLQTKSSQHEMADAYLLAYASCYVFPELLGVKDRNDHKAFIEAFAAKFHPLGVKRIKYVADPGSGTEVVIMTTASAVLIVFRGSECSQWGCMIKDWLTNTTATLTSASELGKGVKVHRGMWKALDTVYEYVAKEVEEQGGFTKKRVYATGHSLGGGLALLCGVRMSVEDKGKAVIYTFGAPRTGNFEFRQAAKDLDVHRWVNKKDVVPMLPSDRWMSYKHVGQTHNIKCKGGVCLDDVELRAYAGSARDHHVYRYLEGLHSALPEELKRTMPEPP